MDHRWNAFCTVHWFLTGVSEVHMSTDPITQDLLAWFTWLENRYAF